MVEVPPRDCGEAIYYYKIGVYVISYVWSDALPVYAGRGGTESYTIGHIRQLNELGLRARLITIGLGEDDGRQYFPDVEFLSLDSPQQLAELDDTIIYVTIPHAVKTRRPSYVILHCPPSDVRMDVSDIENAVTHSTLITNSRFMRSLWADYLDLELDAINIAYPFADPCFASVKRVKMKTPTTRVLYAGRLIHEKGVYSLLEALHHDTLRTGQYSFTVTTSGNETIHGQVVEKLLRAHPWVRVIGARRNPAAMARLFGRYDIVVVPSNHQFWHEAFGMVSVEAQHAGCRVVASNSGGLPETNCGELILYKPGDSSKLAEAIAKAAKAGPLTKAQRREATRHFTLHESVDSLLEIIRSTAQA